MAQLTWTGRAATAAGCALLCAAGCVALGQRAPGEDPENRTATTAAPADPQAGPAARAELGWLGTLPARGSGPRLLSGYFGGYGSGFDAHAWSAGGHLPGLIGCDYADIAPNGHPVLDTSCNAQLRAYAAAGGLVTVSVHGPNPAGGSLDTPLSPAQFAQLTQPGTAIGKAWTAQLDTLAAGLRQLSDGGVPVLFRPLLEMNGGAFWWDGQSPAAFRAVWQDMVTRIGARLGPTDHQVLWVWSPGCGSDGQGNAGVEAYYPGDAYADVIGADCYTNQPTAGVVAQTYRDLSGFAARHGKVFAFSEIGGDNAGDGAASRVDFAAWITALQHDYPRTAYFLAWNGPVGPTGARNGNGASLLTDPGVIDQGQAAAQGLRSAAQGLRAAASGG